MLIYHLQYPTLCSVPQRMILIFILIIFNMLNLIFTLIIFNMPITIGADGSHKEQDSQGFAEPGEGRTLPCWLYHKNDSFMKLQLMMLVIYDCDL